jgi:hypothetical protein
LTSGIQAAGAPASVRPAEPVAPAPRASGCATLDPGRGNVSAGFLIALALLSVRARRRRH